MTAAGDDTVADYDAIIVAFIDRDIGECFGPSLGAPALMQPGVLSLSATSASTSSPADGCWFKETAS